MCAKPLLGSFWVNKYSFLQLSRQKPPAGDYLVKVTRAFAALLMLVHSVAASHFYYRLVFVSWVGEG